MSNIKHFNNAEKNFRGMESFMQEIRQIAVEVYQENNLPKPEPKKSTTTVSTSSPDL